MSRLQFYDIAGAHRPPRIALVIERFDARRGGVVYPRPGRVAGGRRGRRAYRGPPHWRRRIRRLAARQFTAPSSMFLAVSRRVAHDLMHLHAVPAERIRVVYNGVDTERFSPQRHRDAGELIRKRYGIGSNEVLVIAVANNHRLKGIHVLARAIRQLRSAGVPIKALVCGGACPGRADRDKGVIYAGHVTDPAAHYAAADIAAQPSFYDACSLTTLEALASGLPVITTSANGAGELITHGLNGLVLADARDARPLAAALGWLAADRWQRGQLGRAGRSLALVHGVEQAFGGVVTAYAEVAAARGERLVHEPATGLGRRIAA